VKTFVIIRALRVGDRRFQHGDELPPDLLPQQAVDIHLDRRELIEYDSAERRSLYRLLHRFSGCSEREHLSNEEHAAYALTE
jgi:hypothetical protein